MDVRTMTELELKEIASSDNTTRLEAVRKIDTELRRRTHHSFNLARSSLPFTATDIGSLFYVTSAGP